ncbi:putative disease resistance protein RGA3 isoform X2 [Carex rostrata]
MLSTIKRVLNLIYRSGRYDLKIETEKLDRKLRWIQATVEELERRELHDETLKLWLQELKCLASDAEDVLDEYHYELLRCEMEVKPAVTAATLSGKVAGMESNSAMVSPVSSRFSESISVEMIEKIRQINSKFDEISRDRDALRVTNEEAGRRAGICSVNLSPTGHLMNKDGIFGRSDDKKKIIELLLSWVLWDEERKDQLQVIPILGMGGIGKTSLAQIVYNDPFVQSMFDVMAWIHVSPEFDILRITKEISEFVTGNSGNSFDGFSKIQEVLQKELAGQTMLLVLDDVYNVQPNNWEILFLPLRVAKLVRVLVTSRSDDVAKTLNTVTPLN